MKSAKEHLRYLRSLPLEAFADETFDDPSYFSIITGPMPDEEEYKKKMKGVSKEAETVALELRCFYTHPLLNKEQEVHLFRKMNFYKYWAIKLLKQTPSVRKLRRIDRYLKHAQNLNHHLASANIRLVMNIAKKQQEFFLNGNQMNTLYDIISDGNMGLIRSVAKFDWRKNFKFSTYATWAIVHSMSSEKQIRDKHKQHTVNCVEEQVLETCPDKREIVYDEENSKYLDKLLDVITPKQKDIISKYYLREMTLKELGVEYGITKERIRQIKNQGLTKIRKMLVEDRT